MAETETRQVHKPGNDLPPKPIWQYTQMELSYLVGRLARIARKPFGQDHFCTCLHAVSHHHGSGKCAYPRCECKKVELADMLDQGCDCAVCIAKDAFGQVKSLIG